MRGVFGIFHLIAEFKQGIFDIVEAIWGGLAGSRAADRRHVGEFAELCFQGNQIRRIKVSRECEGGQRDVKQQLVVCLTYIKSSNIGWLRCLSRTETLFFLSLKYYVICFSAGARRLGVFVFSKAFLHYQKSYIQSNTNNLIFYNRHQLHLFISRGRPFASSSQYTIPKNNQQPNTPKHGAASPNRPVQALSSRQTRPATNP